jgi:hypothetical protein
MNKDVSFYFFDFDDNIMYLKTTIFIKNMVTKEIIEVSTGDFANIHPSLGKSGKWADFATFDGSYSNFSDIPAAQLPQGKMQHFVEDIKEATEADPSVWQAPSWKLFAYACEKQRPVSIITARGHNPETIKAGIRILVDKKLIRREPEYLSIFPVDNKPIRIKDLGDDQLEMKSPTLKRRAIIKSVDLAMEKYGSEPAHRFGMSDDDPANVELIITAMCECKKKYMDKRFFVINTHLDEMVKLEVFPVYGPARRNFNESKVDLLF